MSAVASDMTNARALVGGGVNFCYLDESGTGSEPVATMVGIVVDAGRMHLTKRDWMDLLEILSDAIGRSVAELHTADFYHGNGVWRGLDGDTRAEVTSAILKWLSERKHHVVYASVDKFAYSTALGRGAVPKEVGTLWRFLGFHVTLAIQRYSQREKNNKGQTTLIFDNYEKERRSFPDLVLHPPAWSDEYYARKEKQAQLDQIVDVPYFGDSKDVPLLQVADFLSFFLRRHAELAGAHYDESYDGEAVTISDWAGQLAARSIGRAHIYPKTRTGAQELFYTMAPPCIRDL